MAKATAVRNIRDDHQKAFLKIFNSLCGRFNRWQVWQDFVMVTAIEISNATDKKNAPERTKTYQTIISKYSDAEQEKFAELLGEVIMGMEQNPDQDFLGELYMLCELGNDASDYFKAGNSKVANKHSATGTAAVWWLRSPNYYLIYLTYSSFCEVSSSGSLDYYSAYYAYGVVPGFVV